jgi:hypothetical protein
MRCFNDNLWLSNLSNHSCTSDGSIQEQQGWTRWSLGPRENTPPDHRRDRAGQPYQSPSVAGNLVGCEDQRVIIGYWQKPMRAHVAHRRDEKCD